MLLIHQSPHVRQSRLAEAITLDDFVAVIHVAIHATTKQWSVCLLNNSGDGAPATLTNAGLSITWDSGRKTVQRVAGFGNGVQMLRIERVGNEFSLVTLDGSFPMVDVGDGIDGPIAFDLIGGLTDSPGCRVLAAAILPFTELSPESLASAVWTASEGAFLYAVAHNRVVTDPVAGTFTVYDTDDTTVLYTADLWADASGTTPYSGSGAERRDRLT